MGAGLYLIQARSDTRLDDTLFLAVFAFLLVTGTLIVLLWLLTYLRRKPFSVSRALELARAGHPDEAVVQIRRSIERSGKTSQRVAALGDCRLLQGDWREAYILFVEAERLDGAGGRYLAKQGFALSKLGRVDEAIQLIRQAADLDPTNPGPLSTACLVLVDHGRVEEAKAVLTQAEQLVTDQERADLDLSRTQAIRYSLAACRKRLADFEEPGSHLEPASPV